MKVSNKTKLGLALSSLLIANGLHAGGFALTEQSARLIGSANAGTAVSDDPSASFFNPAAMTQIDKLTVSGTNAGVFVRSTFTPTLATGFDGRPLTGSTNSQALDAYVPAMYVIYPINDRFVAGISVVSPFGLATNYGNDSIARYFGILSEIKTININPSIAFKANEFLSVGFGINAMWAQSKLSQATPFTLPGVPVVEDLYLFHKGDSWGWGWNAGIMFEKGDSKVGLSYRSRIKQDIKGRVSISTPNDPRLRAGARALGLVDRAMSFSATLPDSIILSASHQLTEKLKVLLDVQLMRWSSLQDVAIHYGPVNGVAPGRDALGRPSELALRYKDAWRVAIGQEYEARENVFLRAGVAYDGSPVNQRVTTVRLPDGDRVWLTLGIGAQVTDSLTIDVGYARLIFSNPIRVSMSLPAAPPAVPARLDANYHNGVDVVSVQFTKTFD